MKFGELLRKIRKQHGLSLDGLSVLSGVHKSNLCKIENSDLNPPRSFEAVERILARTGFSEMEKFDLLQAALNHHREELEARFKRPSTV